MSHQQALATAEPQDLAPAEQGASMFERLARDPSVDVGKLERLMALHERMTAKQAEMAYNAAMSEAQAQMKPVVADAYNPQTRSKFASYEALDEALRPIYTAHGFGLSFDTDDSPQPEHVRVLCKVTHGGGHASVHKVDMPADGKGAKGGDVMTKTHATGSAFSYGQRYLLRLIWNIAIAKDDDGNGAAGKVDPKPEGYDDWLLDLEATADNGSKAFGEAFKASTEKRRAYALKHDHARLNKAKVKAVAATEKAKAADKGAA